MKSAAAPAPGHGNALSQAVGQVPLPVGPDEAKLDSFFCPSPISAIACNVDFVQPTGGRFSRPRPSTFDTRLLDSLSPALGAISEWPRLCELWMRANG